MPSTVSTASGNLSGASFPPLNQCCRLEARQAQNGLPEVSIRELLSAALRHHPDRIILGEVRAQEANELLQLLNTGQSGSLFTLHASSAKQALAGLANCVLQSGADLSYRAIKTSIGHCVNVVIQLEQRPGRRFVSQVVEVKGFDEEADEFDLSTVFGREPKSPRIAKTFDTGRTNGHRH